MNCANFLEYNPKIYIIFWNTIHKIHVFCGYVYQNQTELYKLENIDVHIYVCNLSQSIPVSKRGVSCRVLCDVQRTHNTFRVADSLLLCMGNQYYLHMSKISSTFALKIEMVRNCPKSAQTVLTQNAF